MYRKPSSGAGAEELLLADSLNKYPWSWSSDGRFILYIRRDATTGWDLWVLPLFGDRKPFPFLQTPFDEWPGRFSPDRRWIAYRSNESGRNEVYVAPFPGASGKRQISTAGGNLPPWRRDGKEIFYVAPNNKLMAATVKGQGSAFEVGAVRPLFDVRPASSTVRYFYDVSPDGQRFLVNTSAAQSAPPIALIVNWPALLRK